MKIRWASRLLHHLALLLEHLTKALKNLENHQQNLKAFERKLEDCFAPMEFETVRFPGCRRGAGTILHEQRFVFLHRQTLSETTWIFVMWLPPRKELVHTGQPI